MGDINHPQLKFSIRGSEERRSKADKLSEDFARTFTGKKLAIICCYIQILIALNHYAILSQVDPNSYFKLYIYIYIYILYVYNPILLILRLLLFNYHFSPFIGIYLSYLSILCYFMLMLMNQPIYFLLDYQYTLINW